MNQARTPAGLPTGGQFAVAGHAGADVTPAPRDERQVTDLDSRLCSVCKAAATTTILYGTPVRAWNHACDEHAQQLRNGDVSAPSGVVDRVSVQDVRVGDQFVHQGQVLQILSGSEQHRHMREFRFGTPIGSVSFLADETVPLHVPVPAT